MASFICLGLVSTVSAMMWIGPRITAAMGEDLGLLAPLARRNARGIPVSAILAQFAIVVLLLLTATFQNGGQLHPVQPHALFDADGAGRVRAALAAARICRALTAPGDIRSRRSIFLLVSVWMLEHMLSDPSTRDAVALGSGHDGAGFGRLFSFSAKQRRPQPSEFAFMKRSLSFFC